MKRSFESLSAGVQRKRLKVRSARDIASESTSQSLQNGAIPIQDFLSSRRFEIKALTDSMQKSREAGVQRAFQSLPRYLRRRAASHNVKRVPRRLRARALAEATEEDRQSRSRRVPFKRKRGRKGTIQKLARLQRDMKQAERAATPVPDLIPGTELPATRPVSAGRFVNRQREKTWLPSHLWTCKRGKMVVKWGYALPISPNEKTYRSTHRASTSKGAILFDTSYLGHILLKGASETIAQVLLNVTQTRDTCGLRARRGERVIHANVFAQGHLLCPTTVLWNSNSKDDLATVLLSAHPAAFSDVWKIIMQERASLKSDALKIVDMRFQIGSLAVVGPLAMNALLSVLKATGDDECAKAFRSFHGLRPEELPSGCVLPLSIQDPRSAFPPRAIVEPAREHNKYLTTIPAGMNHGPLFCKEQTDLYNVGRPKNTTAEEAAAFPAFPVIVYQSDFGLCVLAPWAYVTDIWYSLNHLPLVRFGGLQEMAQIFHERSLPFFPNDYQGTTAGNALASDQRVDRERWYLRRPPSKRKSYAKAIAGRPEIGDPFTCDFDFLINSSHDLSASDLSHVSVSILDKSSALDTTVDVTMEDVNVTAPLYTSTPQIAVAEPGSIPKETISQPKETIETPKEKVVLKPVLIHKSQLSSLTSSQGNSGIIHIKIKMIQRGSPKSCARIYQNDHGSAGSLIGFVTTGNFSLAEGRATAVGSILAKHAQIHAEDKKRECFVRDSGCEHFRLATWSII